MHAARCTPHAALEIEPSSGRGESRTTKSKSVARGLEVSVPQIKSQSGTGPTPGRMRMLAAWRMDRGIPGCLPA